MVSCGWCAMGIKPDPNMVTGDEGLRLPKNMQTKSISRMSNLNARDGSYTAGGNALINRDTSTLGSPHASKDIEMEN